MFYSYLLLFLLFQRVGFVREFVLVFIRIIFQHVCLTYGDTTGTTVFDSIHNHAPVQCSKILAVHFLDDAVNPSNVHQEWEKCKKNTTKKNPHDIDNRMGNLEFPISP